MFSATFIQEDASVDPSQFYKYIPDNIYFDMASCQFSMHYMFLSEQKVRNWLQNATKKILNGGYFVCTHPDANVIVKKIREDSFWDEKTECWVSENRFYSLISSTKEFPKTNGPFGFPYGFFLTDNLVGFREELPEKHILHYVPEYLVIVPSLVKIAREYGLELVESKNLHEFYSENINDRENYELFTRRMKFKTDSNMTFLMDKDLWDVSYLYRILVFQKVEGGEDASSFDRSTFKGRNYFKVHKKEQKFN